MPSDSNAMSSALDQNTFTSTSETAGIKCSGHCNKNRPVGDFIGYRGPTGARGLALQIMKTCITCRSNMRIKYLLKQGIPKEQAEATVFEKNDIDQQHPDWIEFLRTLTTEDVLKAHSNMVSIKHRTVDVPAQPMLPTTTCPSPQTNAPVAAHPEKTNSPGGMAAEQMDTPATPPVPLGSRWSHINQISSTPGQGPASEPQDTPDITQPVKKSLRIPRISRLSQKTLSKAVVDNPLPSPPIVSDLDQDTASGQAYTASTQQTVTSYETPPSSKTGNSVVSLPGQDNQNTTDSTSAVPEIIEDHAPTSSEKDNNTCQQTREVATGRFTSINDSTSTEKLSNDVVPSSSQSLEVIRDESVHQPSPELGAIPVRVVTQKRKKIVRIPREDSEPAKRPRLESIETAKTRDPFDPHGRPKKIQELIEFCQSLERLRNSIKDSIEKLPDSTLEALQEEICHDWRIEEMAMFVEGYNLGAKRRARRAGS